MGTEVETTEITELEATKVAGVARPANGTPFIVLKATAEKEDCPTCKGKGTIMEGNRKCPDCQGSGEVAAKETESAEADAEEEEVTGSTSKEEAEWEALDKALSKKDRDAMPASSFAFVDKKGGKHLPIHDEGHVKSALGRFAQQDFSEAKGDPDDAKKKAAGKIKAAAGKHGIELDPKSTVAEAAQKGAVQDALDGTKAPEVAGHLDTGQSGASGSVVTGVRQPPSDSALTLGGQTTAEIPVEAKVTDNPPADLHDGAGIINPQAIAKALAVASLSEAIDQITTQREAIKDGRFLEATGPAAENPGSMPWESYDAATLRQVAECLAGCCSALDNIAERELTEACVADAGDLSNAWDLEEAADALEFALGVAARLSYHEAAEGEATKSVEFIAKVGRTLSGKNESALTAARDHLNSVIAGAQGKQAGDAGDESEEDKIVTTVTKDELAETIATASAAAAVEAVKQIRKDEKKARKAEEAEKNANNGGDVSTGDIKPTSSADADDINSIPDGGHVDPQYVNKSEAEDGTLAKQVADQLDTLTKEIGSVKETVARIAKRPRAGGPSLDGQARGLTPAAEGRQTDGVAKSAEDGEIEQLQKSLETETDPLRQSELGQKLTYARLMKLHGAGQL
jgi:hypothetical protein